MLNRLNGRSRSFESQACATTGANGAGRGTKSWIAPADNRYFLPPRRRPCTASQSSRYPFQLRHIKRQRTELPAIHRQIDRVFAKLLKANLLDHHDEMGGHRPLSGMEFYLQRRIEF